ncbi:hypothetical protein G5V58_08095 [Nocardioides anomalus]|uniref:Cleaved adhesin domain-containing protein n=1 Tax=Nocardioides anomalus TaxID=2712223 RepID=A0A6G6WC65_9ACTN|nr:hypothetical protein [Nocardioides anomalus]QIG42747.1 hypothetical protein G5V58_08095 [Nocardioides anomalus]
MATSLVVLAPFAAAPASAAELLGDGGFENATGNPLNSPSWTEADNRRSGSPLCSTSTCNGVSPHGGSRWVAFGGSPSTAPHNASVSQSVTFPSGGTALLTYWYANQAVSSCACATVRVQVDGTTVKTHTEGSSAQASYTQQTVNLSQYANGASHTVAFVYANTTSGTKVMSIDDVSLTYTAPPAVPRLTSVTPTSPNPSTSPVIRGTSDSGSTVRLYTTSGCTGTAVATVSASALSAGVPLTVTLGSTTTYRATATNAAGGVSACSAPLAYTADLPDGGFEAASGNPAVTPFWTAADSLAGTPVVTSSIYTPGSESAPRSGKAWVWFGGFPDAGHTGSVSQSVVLPAGGAVALTFWYRNSDVSAPYDAQLLVQVDGRTVRTITESTVADPAYTKQVVDLSAYADGTGHVLAFSYRNGGEGVTNMLVDDVSLSPVTGTRVPVPTVRGTSPATQGTSVTPSVVGSADPGSTVWLFPNASCTGTPLGSGSAAAFAGAGIPAQVPAGATTTLYAKASAVGRDDSACSTTSATYRSVAAPDTTLTKAPGSKVKTRKKKAKIVFAFTSTTPGATFQCSVDGGAYAACTSGVRLKLKAGKHTFAVRAVAAGLSDPTPATWTGKVKRKKKR